jgi:hypothetical protein
MKTVTLGFCLAVFAYGVALANESRHAATVDMPKVVTLTHASPDTWYTLPPVQPHDEPTSTAASNLGGPLVFGQVGRLEPRRGAGSTEVSRNNLSLVEFP